MREGGVVDFDVLLGAFRGGATGYLSALCPHGSHTKVGVQPVDWTWALSPALVFQGTKQQLS
ncbi:hypothetical protein [Streptomyces hydrogenans]